VPNDAENAACVLLNIVVAFMLLTVLLDMGVLNFSETSTVDPAIQEICPKILTLTKFDVSFSGP
jgi:hypothetical protein